MSTEYSLTDPTGAVMARGRAYWVRMCAANLSANGQPFRVHRLRPDGSIHLDVTECVLDAVGWALLKPYLREERRDLSSASK